jgi:hypothetical protein
MLNVCCLPSHLHLATEIVPSSARSVAAIAEPLPKQLAPLLEDTLERTRNLLGTILPLSKKRSVLEEAEWEDENEEGALEREIMMQCKCPGLQKFELALTVY